MSEYHYRNYRQGELPCKVLKNMKRLRGCFSCFVISLIRLLNTQMQKEIDY